ncbi:lysophospholipid acyltransferase family protein [Marinibactrum halimedae]|uniref:Lysophosphatidic acid acyltransferase n=1 Tax=Marinibactrum halimedae TaxID=1444977 RepID=A0AA37T9H6_9GAMM|nr:lysophospholipid acyltransferase family protein [Marinibactrum halimedae]MCD9460031.1 1-acyl-sn-glycerol-3-phosphate acyltransferase [Marinibactrum halimedae]GLS28201.1 lysophosphatidic acid acyltransferase [Marinibactrum halimedae]
MTFFRSLIFNTLYSLSTCLFGLYGLVICPFLPQSWGERGIIVWNRFIVLCFRWVCGVRLKVVGQLPTLDQPYVILANHQSSWETFYLQSLFFPMSTILKQELLKIPFFGWGLAQLKPIAIDRSNPMKALKQVKREGMATINQGRSLLVFPQGTRVSPGETGTYARSGADIAIGANAPIIPIAHNAGSCWVNKSFIKRPGTITVHIGEPLQVDGKSSKEVMAIVQEWIESRIATKA